MVSQAFPAYYLTKGCPSNLQDSASRPSRYSTQRVLALASHQGHTLTYFQNHFHNPKSFRDEGRCQKQSASASPPPWKVYILIQMIRTQSKYKNRNSTLPLSASHVFPCLRPNQPISALSGNRSTNANCTHIVPSHFIVLPARHPYFSAPTCPSPDLILDIVRAGCRPIPPCGFCRPRLCSG